MRKLLLITFTLGIVLSIPCNVFAQSNDDSEMEYGDTHYGTITDTNWYNYHCFQGTAGDEIVISMETISGNLDGLLILSYLASDGDWYEVGRVDDYQGSLNPYAIETLSHTTEYCFAATRSGFSKGLSTGSYSIRLELLNLHEVTDEEAESSRQYMERLNESISISYGETKLGYISDQDYESFFCFYGSAGDEISAAMRATSGDLDGYLILDYQENSGVWQQIDLNDDHNSNNLDPYLSLVLPYSGQYCLQTTRFGEADGVSTGGFALDLTSSNNSNGKNNGSPGHNTGCPDDEDCDGLTDTREQWFIDTFTPYFQYDEEEHDIINDQDPSDFGEFAGVAYMYQVSQVDCSYIRYDSDYIEDDIIYDPYPALDTSPDTVLMTVVAIYGYDYAPMDSVIPFDDEDDEFNHYGDTEAVRVCLTMTDQTEDTVTYNVDFVHVVRHSHHYAYYNDELFFLDGSHPVLNISEGKHASYNTKDSCEHAVSGLQWLAWDEDCSSYNEDAGKLIIPSYRPNVGEYSEEKIDWLSQYGIDYSAYNMVSPSPYFFALNDPEYPYIDEAVWHSETYAIENQLLYPRDRYFCGTYDVEEYNDHHWILAAELPKCAGSLKSKWWQPSIDETFSYGP